MSIQSKYSSDNLPVNPKEIYTKPKNMPTDFRLESNYSLALPEFDRTIQRNKQNVPLDEDQEYQKHVEPFKQMGKQWMRYDQEIIQEPQNYQLQTDFSPITTSKMFGDAQNIDIPQAFNFLPMSRVQHQQTQKQSLNQIQQNPQSNFILKMQMYRKRQVYGFLDQNEFQSIKIIKLLILFLFFPVVLFLSLITLSYRITVILIMRIMYLTSFKCLIIENFANYLDFFDIYYGLGQFGDCLNIVLCYNPPIQMPQ